MNRRIFLGTAAAAFLRARTALEVAYAGSMASVMEGPMRRAVAADLGLELEGRAQGASGLARLIASGSIRPDVFLSITRSPVETVLQAGKADDARPVARTEMVIAYSPKSRFAPRLGAEPWWEVLEQPAIRFGRTDPVTDPQGRNIIFVLQLAASLYGQPDLPRRILGSDVNPQQIFTEPSIQARLQSGALDAASAYKVQPAAFHLPYIRLPEEINLASGSHFAQYRRASLTLNGQTYYPEPLVYYAAALKEAPHHAEALRFMEWLQGKSAQEVLRRAGYDPAGDTTI